MDTHISYESPNMTDAEVIRAVFPRHTTKHLARMMNVPLDTARHWLYRTLSAARRREVALALLKKWDEEDRQRAACRQFLEKMAKSNEMGMVGDCYHAAKNWSA